MNTNTAVIVALSGGLASAYCAKWALETYPKERVILYFNDTHWEHPDLYRFLDDLSRYFDHPITRDSDPRSPEQLFYDQRALANNRMPFCSRILKAERLKKFFNDGDTIVFGISLDEAHRADRIVRSYYEYGVRKNKWAKLQFPLISNRVTKEQCLAFCADAGIRIPLLYDLGFTHNNCNGGCVRAGKKQWLHLLRTLPDVYADRERVEQEMQEFLRKPVTILKGASLTELRRKQEAATVIDFGDAPDECLGACSTEN